MLLLSERVGNLRGTIYLEEMIHPLQYTPEAKKMHLILIILLVKRFAQRAMQYTSLMVEMLVLHVDLDLAGCYSRI